MQKRALFLAGTILVVVSYPLTAAKKSGDKQRLERLEHRMLELERRLEASEAENAHLRASQSASSTVGGALQKDKPDTLDQRIKLIEHGIKEDKAASDAARAKSPKVELGSQGLKVETSDGKNTLYLRGMVQADGRFFMDDSRGNPTNTNGDNISDQFLVRRARIILEGTLWKYFDYRVMPEFATSQTRLFDAYVDFRPFQEISLTVENLKPPSV